MAEARHRRTLSARCETSETRETCLPRSPHPPDRFSSLRDEVRGRLYPLPAGEGKVARKYEVALLSLRDIPFRERKVLLLFPYDRNLL